MVIDEKEAVGEPSTTLAFLSDDIIAGAIACRAYVAHFRVEDGRVRFPAMSMTGTTEGCAGHQLDSEGSYTDQLSLSYDYSVEETGSGKQLRIRTKNGEVLMFEPLLRDGCISPGCISSGVRNSLIFPPRTTVQDVKGFDFSKTPMLRYQSRIE